MASFDTCTVTCGFVRTCVVILTLMTYSDCLYKKPKEIKPFDDTPMTITVVSGTTALLPCEVDPNITEMNPDIYKVVWVNPLETVVSMQERRLLNDMRISVERLRTRDWNLHIRNVSVTDAGVYKCQLNVSPVGNKHITLVVHEPPRIVEHTSPAIVKKREGDTVEIYCNATGTPQPTVKWFRVNKRDESRERVGNTGESLVIHNISRSCADFYECIADNGVQPSMSQKFEVIVNYKPEVVLGNTRLNQALGKDTVLDCEVYASPVAAAWWQHKDRKIFNTDRHVVQAYPESDDKVLLTLNIKKITREDYGAYECLATNDVGSAKMSMELQETVPKTTTTTTEPTTPYHHIDENRISRPLEDNHRKHTHTKPKTDIVSDRQPSSKEEYMLGKSQDNDDGNTAPSLNNIRHYILISAATLATIFIGYCRLS